MIRCPQCRNIKDFTIYAREYIQAHVTQNKEGFILRVYDSDPGDIEWDENDWCICQECRYGALLEDFEVSEKEEKP